MKKLNLKKSSLVTLSVIAIALLLVSGVNLTKAALTYQGDGYSAKIEMDDIGVSLYEQSANDSSAHKVAFRDYQDNGEWSEQSGTLLDNMLGSNESLEFGKPYTEKLFVENSGTIGQYVRVNVYKYWTDPDGNKATELNPALIDLNVKTGNGWIIDNSATTPERTVLYYNKVLKTGDKTPAFTDLLTVYIDQKMVNSVKQTTESKKEGNTNYTKYTTTYDYDGYKFVIEADVDAIQDHNAEDAAHSAWGENVNISGGILSIK